MIKINVKQIDENAVDGLAEIFLKDDDLCNKLSIHLPSLGGETTGITSWRTSSKTNIHRWNPNKYYWLVLYPLWITHRTKRRIHTHLYNL